jgi:hypothetical protein
MRTGLSNYLQHIVSWLLFIVAMGMLAFRRREPGSTNERGWRFIRYSAGVLILWSMASLLVRYFGRRHGMVEAMNAGGWSGPIRQLDGSMERVLVYLDKMDHLALLSAVLLLFFGLRILLDQARESRESVVERRS